LTTSMLGANNYFHSCSCYTCIKWLSNSYSSRLFPSFKNCHFCIINEVVLTWG
jgi:hypothetical protein